MVKMEERTELLAQIVKCFEDFLEERGIEVPTSQEEKRREDPDWEHNDAVIYGLDFGEVMESVADVLVSWKLLEVEK